MRTNRVAGSLFGLLFLACVLACGGAGDPGGPGGTGAAGAKKPDWRDRLKAEREKRSKRVEDAEKAVKDTEAELADTKKKHKQAIERIITVGKNKEFKDRIKGLEEQVDRRKQEVRDARQFAAFQVGPEGLNTGDFVNLGGSPLKLIQVVGPGQMLVEWQDRTVWLHASTQGMTDDRDRSFTFTGFAECLGTRQYANALGGTRAVLELFLHGKE